MVDYYMEKKRNDGIDILKFFAVILILNSHFDTIYVPPFDKIATGGTIGDALFFLCSGFTMLLGRESNFFNFYKKRIYRIYPSVFAWAIIGVILFKRDDSLMTLVQGGWFVNCIMIYYVPIFFIRRYCPNRVRTCIGGYTVLFVCVYILWNRPEDFNLLKDPWMKWWFLFFVMLLGAYLGKSCQELKTQKTDFLFFALSVICFYLFHYAKKYYMDIQVLSIPSLMGICYYGYRICSHTRIVNCYNNHKAVKWVVRFIGGLCLEIYLINLTLISDKMNSLFPLNVLIILTEIIVIAYVVRCLSKFLIQTFSKEDYRWKEIFQLII